MSSASERRASSGGDEGGGANWMDTYGDLVTLLLTFFVLLFSMSTIDAQKWKSLVGSFSGVSVISLDPMSPELVAANPIPMLGPVGGSEQNSEDDDENQSSGSSASEEEVSKQILARLGAIYEFMKDYVAEQEIDAEVVLIADDYQVSLILNNMIFFNTAKADLLPESLPILDKIIEMFREVDQRYTYSELRIEGHCDNRPINTLLYPNNWVLSCHRAVNVGAYIRETGELDSKRLTVLGFGDERPIDTNDTPEGQARNRRVEFVVQSSVPEQKKRPDMEIPETDDLYNMD